MYKEIDWEIPEAIHAASSESFQEILVTVSKEMPLKKFKMSGKIPEEIFKESVEDFL